MTADIQMMMVSPSFPSRRSAPSRSVWRAGSSCTLAISRMRRQRPSDRGGAVRIGREVPDLPTLFRRQAALPRSRARRRLIVRMAER
jgi:hypothetical protein